VSAGIRVVSPGMFTIVEDVGRPGLANQGVGRSGAMDRRSHDLANRLVGNAPDAATLEVLLGGLVFEALEPVWLAITGARGPVRIEREGAADRPFDLDLPVQLGAGERTVVGTAQEGMRYYVAARGGFAAIPVLGSRSYDSLAQLGPPPLVAGDVLQLGQAGGEVPAIDSVAPRPVPDRLRLHRGPRADWFAPTADSALFGTPWVVGSRSNRTGIRLEGPLLERSRADELPSEGTVPGSIQVSSDGVPTILGVDAPVSGGYPVIAVVARQDLDALAQLRPGSAVRFGHAS